MTNTRRQSAHTEGDNGRPNLMDFISKMPDEVLVMILSLMPIKDAVVTSILSTRWRYVWCNMFQLNFDGTETLDKMANDEVLCDLERYKYINQVCNVISSYNHPKVHDFRIRFDLDDSYYGNIDEWIEFALGKQVERLELNLLDKSYRLRDPVKNYEFQLPSSKAMVGEMRSLKKLFLRAVDRTNPKHNLKKFSKSRKALHVWLGFVPIHVGGQGVNLKHFKLVACSGFESISLYGFDFVSFTFSGPEIKLHLTDLPKLKELDIGIVSVGLENNVFSQISSCALYLQALELDLRTTTKDLDVNAILKFPNVKKLKLAMKSEGDDSLLEFTSIAQACPSLETFLISLHWFSPTKRRRKVRRVAARHVHKHLKQLEFIGYYGRISDLELDVYVIENAAALKKNHHRSFIRCFWGTFKYTGMLEEIASCSIFCHTPAHTTIASRCDVGRILIRHSSTSVASSYCCMMSYVENGTNSGDNL